MIHIVSVLTPQRLDGVPHRILFQQLARLIESAERLLITDLPDLCSLKIVAHSSWLKDPGFSVATLVGGSRPSADISIPRTIDNHGSPDSPQPPFSADDHGLNLSPLRLHSNGRLSIIQPYTG